MKKTITTILVVAMTTLTMAVAGCGREDDDLNNNGNGGSGGTEQPTPDPQPTPDSTHTPDGWVDLNLASGLLWATCNLGATAPEEYGNYYAWGEREPKNVYDWDTYTYCNGGDNYQLTKYCNKTEFGYNGFTDNLLTLEAVDDAVTAALGQGAHIPTYANWMELWDATTSEWTTENGVHGWKFTADNGNTLFLPAAGFKVNMTLFSPDSYGQYWSSQLDYSYPCNARYFGFNENTPHMNNSLGSDNRSTGRPIRAVRPAE